MHLAPTMPVSQGRPFVSGSPAVVGVGDTLDSFAPNEASEFFVAGDQPTLIRVNYLGSVVQYSPAGGAPVGIAFAGIGWVPLPPNGCVGLRIVQITNQGAAAGSFLVCYR